MPEPTNPQSLNRYAYVYNNPVRYTDPTGHFTEDEVDAYLEELGYSKDERDKIIAKWMSDDDWWNIIGNGNYGAQAGDSLSGTTLDKYGLVGDWEVLAHFYSDGDTFGVVFGATNNPETSLLTLFRKDQHLEIFSLVDFYDEVVDIIWMQEGEYMGGSGYGANKAEVDWTALWDATRNNTVASVNFVGAVVGLGNGNIGAIGIGLLNGANTMENNVKPHCQAYERSRNAHTRFNRNDLTVNKAVE